MGFRHTTAYFNTLMAIGLLTAGLLFTSCEKMRIRKTKVYVQVLNSINAKPLQGVSLKIFLVGQPWPITPSETVAVHLTDENGTTYFAFSAKNSLKGYYQCRITHEGQELLLNEYSDVMINLNNNRKNRIVFWVVPKAYINYRFESLDPAVVDSVVVSTTPENGEKYGNYKFKISSMDGSGNPYPKHLWADVAAGYNFIHWKLYISGQVTDHYDTLYVDWMEQKDFQITY